MENGTGCLQRKSQAEAFFFFCQRGSGCCRRRRVPLIPFENTAAARFHALYGLWAVFFKPSPASRFRFQPTLNFTPRQRPFTP
jgi:hypothetical protein